MEGYRLRTEALKIAINNHSILQREIGIGNTEQKTVDILNTLSKNIALAKSEFKCQKCGSGAKRLTFHHLIMTCYQEIMPLNQYLMIRNNYKNIVVLCKECHMKYHGNNKWEDILFISEKRIDQVWRDFYEQTKTEAEIEQSIIQRND